jgi:hypothetical protein
MRGRIPPSNWIPDIWRKWWRADPTGDVQLYFHVLQKLLRL